ncbi:hypothetical protein ACPA54_17790 [Uniformispora flossi]|uniref:hypothetical protein n=1 Tax=Uniformispora flossi TaxID=3390723 RepID=UPI003C2B318F
MRAGGLTDGPLGRRRGPSGVVLEGIVGRRPRLLGADLRAARTSCLCGFRGRSALTG